MATKARNMSGFPSERKLRKDHRCVLPIQGVEFVEMRCDIFPDGSKYSEFVAKTGTLSRKTIHLPQSEFVPDGSHRLRLTHPERASAILQGASP
jgi:hypothetical protein